MLDASIPAATTGRAPSGNLNDRLPFHNLYRHGFARVAMAVPRCRVADPAFNAAETIALLHDAARAGAVLVGFPELGLSA